MTKTNETEAEEIKAKLEKLTMYAPIQYSRVQLVIKTSRTIEEIMNKLKGWSIVLKAEVECENVQMEEARRRHEGFLKATEAGIDGVTLASRGL